MTGRRGREMARLGDVAKVSAGNSAPQDKALFENGKYPFVRTADVGRIHKGVIYESSDYLNDRGIEKLRLMEKGTILFPKSGASTFLNHRVMLGMDAYVSSHLATIKANAALVMDGYLLYFLQTIDAKNLVASSGYPSLQTKAIAGISVPLPQLEEQKRIVARLDAAFAEIDAAIETAKQQQAEIGRLKTAALQAELSPANASWQTARLENVGKVCMCKRILKKQTSASGDIPFYKIGTFGKDANSFIPKKIYDEYRKKYSFPKRGDILLSAAGTIGRRVIYNGKPAYFQDSNIVWIDNDERKVLNTFLYHLYASISWGKQATGGVTISRLYNDDLRSIKISFPSACEQHRIVAKLDKIAAAAKAASDAVQQKQANYQALKSAILAQELKASNG